MPLAFFRETQGTRGESGVPTWATSDASIMDSAPLAGGPTTSIGGAQIGIDDLAVANGTVFWGTYRRALSEDVSLTTKSGRERVEPLVPELEARLREATKDKLPQARVVVWPDGTTPHRQEVLYRFWKFLKQQGIRRWSFHSLRHAFISELIRRGAGLEAVRLLATRRSR